MNLNLKDALRNGMRVVGPDNLEYGRIERHDDSAVYVQGRRIPFAAIERLDQDRLHVTTPELWNLTASDPTSKAVAKDTDLGGQARVPLLEEQVEFSTRIVDLGEIRVHKTVESTEEVRRGPLTREDVEIERIAVNRPVDAPEQRRQEGDWLVIPIMREVFVVQKQLMVTEEIRIRKQLVTEEHEVRETIRREQASIEDTRPAEVLPSARRTRAGREHGEDDAAWEELHRDIRDGGR